MAYFSNGTEGDWFEERYCNKCAHGTKETLCPVIVLHMDWNYEAEEGDDKSFALNLLWPLEEDGSNGDCAMFHEKGGE